MEKMYLFSKLKLIFFSSPLILTSKKKNIRYIWIEERETICWTQRYNPLTNLINP